MFGCVQEERKARKMEKIEKDKADGTFVAVFKVNDLSSKKNRYKVDIHASQCHPHPLFLGRFSPVLRRFCAVLSRGFRLPGAKTERTGERWRKMGEIWGEKRRRNRGAESVCWVQGGYPRLAVPPHRRGRALRTLLPGAPRTLFVCCGCVFRTAQGWFWVVG